MKKQIKRKIYLLSKGHLKPIEVVQYETGVQLIFEVQDIDLDTSATATLFVRKPSGKFVFQEDNISLTGNTVVIDLHNQAITEYGHPFFQIKFKKDEEVISTFSGMLTVEKSLDDSGAEESKTVLAAFDKLTDEEIAKIEEATRSQIELMKAEVEAKGETVLSTIPDEYTEIYNRVNTLFNSVANAIKGTVSGSVVRVDDVSPVEHKPVVKVVCPEGVDLSTMKVKRCGKNIFDINSVTTFFNNKLDVQPESIAKIDEGTIISNLGLYGVIIMCNPGIAYLASGEYTISVDAMSNRTEGNKQVKVVIQFDDDTYITCINKELLEYGKWERLTGKATIENGKRVKGFAFQGTGVSDDFQNLQIHFKNIQLELSKEASDYEPYKGTKHTPSSDGTVEGITSLSPVMTLLTDTEGITIECEYNKDTGKVIEKLTNAVASLGGVV